MCLSVRPYVSLYFDIFPKRNDFGGQKEPGKIFKIKKIGAHKEAIGAHKEAMVAKKSLK